MAGLKHGGAPHRAGQGARLYPEATLILYRDMGCEWLASTASAERLGERVDKTCQVKARDIGSVPARGIVRAPGTAGGRRPRPGHPRVWVEPPPSRPGRAVSSLSLFPPRPLPLS